MSNKFFREQKRGERELNLEVLSIWCEMGQRVWLSKCIYLFIFLDIRVILIRCFKNRLQKEMMSNLE